MILGEKLIGLLVKVVARKFKLDKVLKYVEEPNELDDKVDNLNDRVKLLEKYITTEGEIKWAF